jgi:hypothetical protein
VLELRALHRDVRGLRPRRVELRLRLRHVRLRRGTALVAIVRELERRLEGFHGLVEELLAERRRPGARNSRRPARPAD